MGNSINHGGEQDIEGNGEGEAATGVGFDEAAGDIGDVTMTQHLVSPRPIPRMPDLLIKVGNLDPILNWRLF